jgi:hypothetical protein
VLKDSGHRRKYAKMPPWRKLGVYTFLEPREPAEKQGLY